MSGETMRDRFAMEAMIAWIARRTDLDEEQVAKIAYAQADAMMKARGGDAPQGAGDAVKQQMLEALRELQRICADIPAVERNPRFAEARRASLAAIAAAEKEQSA